MRGWHQYKFDPCVFYKNESVILTYVGGCVTVSYTKGTITKLIESLNNGPENYALTDEGDISNYLGVNIKKNPDGTFELLQSHLVEKIINHVRLTVTASLRAREAHDWKSLLHKDKYSLGRKCVCNLRAAVGMLIYLQGSTRPEIKIAVHQCASFFNNPCLVHKYTVRIIINFHLINPHM